MTSTPSASDGGSSSHQNALRGERHLLRAQTVDVAEFMRQWSEELESTPCERVVPEPPCCRYESLSVDSTYDTLDDPAPPCCGYESLSVVPTYDALDDLEPPCCGNERLSVDSISDAPDDASDRSTASHRSTFGDERIGLIPQSANPMEVWRQVSDELGESIPYECGASEYSCCEYAHPFVVFTREAMDDDADLASQEDERPGEAFAQRSDARVLYYPRRVDCISIEARAAACM
eukprot:CAMPEP_0117486712 /NCGR_PEP_ID=MMETSP0784-20121206/15619_1 /TAXON_ID=39447 /ORGANISM="" /LENGTH=233 /DNA_ID=CAMNT_0005281333 /DNA_START=63 /DNA_END=764 /DNA_ORIENTATION=+